MSCETKNRVQFVLNNYNNFQLHILCVIEKQLQMRVTRCPYYTSVQLKSNFQKQKVHKTIKLFEIGV